MVARLPFPSRNGAPRGGAPLRMTPVNSLFHRAGHRRYIMLDEEGVKDDQRQRADQRAPAHQRTPFVRYRRRRNFVDDRPPATVLFGVDWQEGERVDEFIPAQA